MVGYNSVVLAFQIEQGGCVIAYASRKLMGDASCRHFGSADLLYCLLVIMDYFAKWVDAVPLCDQTAVSISDAIIKPCSGV